MISPLTCSGTASTAWWPAPARPRRNSGVRTTLGSSRVSRVHKARLSMTARPTKTTAGSREVAGLEVLQPLARDGHTSERAIGKQQPDHRGLRLKQWQDALGDSLPPLADVERLGEPAGHARQLIGVSP